ncbi:MAG: tyrosine-type recombinase/integrase [Bryobacteraceae bacterium]|jgi:site-specific recombinase XerD
MTIQDACPLFLAHGRAERQYAKETMVKLRDCFNAWILPCLGDKELERLSRTDLITFRSELVDNKLGINRQYSILMTLKSLLKFARQVLKIHTMDPNTEIRLPQRPKPHVVYLNNEEVERLRMAIRTNSFSGLRMRTLVEVLLGTGLRISEALSLDRTPFEMGHSQVEVIGKGKKPRVAFFPETAIYWIKQFLYYRSDDCPALFITTGNPRRWDRNDLSKYFKELKKQARIDKPVTPHILRHYASSRTMLPRRRPGAFCGLSGQTDVA